MFNSERLIFARKRRGLTKKQLAQDVGVDVKSITNYESATRSPSDNTVISLAQVLKFPIDFFYDPDTINIPKLEAVSFRSLARMTASKRDSALCVAGLAELFDEWMVKHFSLPKPDILELSNENPELAAEILRREWGIGELSIKNMIHLLESKGVRVYSLTDCTSDVDAFSFWKNNTPFIFLNTKKTAERSRFDAAHELGHLVLHKQFGSTGGGNPKQAEKEADTFASSFLMPRNSVLALAPTFITLNSLLEMKKHWLVSVSALAYRLNTLGLLTEWQYRTLNMEISQKGWRKNEPNTIMRERSQIIDKVMALLKEQGISKSTIANELNIDVSELNQFIFGLPRLKLL